MANDGQRHNVGEIRRLLNMAFDDVGLVALCQDEFPEISQKLSRGLRKDEIVNVIMEHFIRLRDFSPLLTAIQVREPQLYACAETNLFGSVYSRIPLPYEIAIAHKFDLTELVTECLDYLLQRRGLIGLAIPCSSPIFLNNFCERLKYEWRRSGNKISLKPCLVISPIHTTLDRAILTISGRYKLALKEGDVLFSVQVSEASMVDRFWHSLCQTIEGEELLNRFIVLITINTDCTLPRTLISLRQPHFRPAHVLIWISQVVQHLAWPEQIIQAWTDQVMAECSYEDELQIDWVYDHLEAMLDLLRKRPTLEEFQQELERRRQLYVETSP